MLSQKQGEVQAGSTAPLWADVPVFQVMHGRNNSGLVGLVTITREHGYAGNTHLLYCDLDCIYWFYSYIITHLNMGWEAETLFLYLL